MHTVEKCPICDHDKFETVFKAKDYSFTQEEFTVVACQDCSFQFTNPIPSEDKIGDYYKSDNYISHTSSKKGLFERLYHLVRRYTIRKKFKLVSKGLQNGKLLDIGCGTGDFLAYSKEKNWSVQGIEPGEDARNIALEKEIEVHAADILHQLENKQFDRITMWHVLEHVYHLNKDFQKISDLLAEDGLLFVAVPNRSSYDAQHFGKYWAAYDLPIHLYHFTPKDIHQLADKYQMQVLKVLPMKFDSYYVSMLSDQYKRGNKKMSFGNIWRGFWVGLRSNLKADREHYSSQIYVLRNRKN